MLYSQREHHVTPRHHKREQCPHIQDVTLSMAGGSIFLSLYRQKGSLLCSSQALHRDTKIMCWKNLAVKNVPGLQSERTDSKLDPEADSEWQLRVSAVTLTWLSGRNRQRMSQNAGLHAQMLLRENTYKLRGIREQRTEMGLT